MAPTNEIVHNKMLSGSELRKIILSDTERLLANDGLLSDHIAYGRITYEIIIRKHLDNFMKPEDVSWTYSTPKAGVVERGPALKDTSPEAIVDAQCLTRVIDSPNAERIRTGMPVPVIVSQPDGTATIEQVKYPPQPDLGEGNVKVYDVTAEARENWGLPPEKSTVVEVGPVSLKRGTPELEALSKALSETKPSNIKMAEVLGSDPT